MGSRTCLRAQYFLLLLYKYWNQQIFTKTYWTLCCQTHNHGHRRNWVPPCTVLAQREKTYQQEAELYQDDMCPPADWCISTTFTRQCCHTIPNHSKQEKHNFTGEAKTNFSYIILCSESVTVRGLKLNNNTVFCGWKKLLRFGCIRCNLPNHHKGRNSTTATNCCLVVNCGENEWLTSSVNLQPSTWKCS